MKGDLFLSLFMDYIFEHFTWHHGWHNGFRCPNNSWNDSYSSQNYRIIFIYVWILDEGLSFLHNDLLKLVSSSCSISLYFCHFTKTFFSNILEILNWLLCPIHGDRIFSSYCPCSGDILIPLVILLLLIPLNQSIWNYNHHINDIHLTKSYIC